MTLFFAGALAVLIVEALIIRAAGLTVTIRRHRRVVHSSSKQKRKEMLSTPQQQLLSALLNQGVKYSEAERIAVELPRNLSFDEMFKRAIAILRPPKEERAA